MVEAVEKKNIGRRSPVFNGREYVRQFGETNSNEQIYSWLRGMQDSVVEELKELKGEELRWWDDFARAAEEELIKRGLVVEEGERLTDNPLVQENF